MNKRINLLIKQLSSQGVKDLALLEVMANLPREHFIDEAFEHKAWDNVALPIGYGQTISQPYMVARMTELLELNAQANVLEIGTGSGYQTAILAHLAQHVYSVERIKGLQWRARRRLKQLDIHNVSIRHGDGGKGWPSRGPFDAIIVTAASPEIPFLLLKQLANDGIMVLPVGKEQQFLQRVRCVQGEFIYETIESVRFVPLIQGELM